MTEFKINTHEKLNTEDLQSEFMDWMRKEYDGYIYDEESISAHDIDDFNWFVNEFFKEEY